MSKRAIVYRAEAYYEDPRLDTSHNFLTKKARDAWAWRRRKGYEETYVEDGFFGDHREAIPPAKKVLTMKSATVIEWIPSPWWVDLSKEGILRYGGYIDSRVRLLGEYYGRAVETVRKDERTRDEILAQEPVVYE